MTKGIKGLPEVEPQSLLMKGAKFLGPLGEVVDGYDKMDKVKSANKKFESQLKVISQCFENEKNKYNGDFKRCITMQQNTLINFEENLHKAVGLDAISPKNIEKIKRVIKMA
jgi:hypothetical protein